MKITVVMDESCTEPQVTVRTAALTEEVQALTKYLQGEKESPLTAYDGREVELLECREILRVYSQQQKVYAQTREGTFALRLRLYEAEEKLTGKGFVRISNSELVNSKKIRSLDAGLSGTIGVNLEGGVRTYASRRYVSRIKKFFGL